LTALGASLHQLLRNESAAAAEQPQLHASLIFEPSEKSENTPKKVTLRLLESNSRVSVILGNF